jgi:hypothetical protein
VVADQVHRLRARDRRRGKQQVEHAGAVRPAVHVIAEVDHDGLPGARARARVRGDEPVQRREPVGAAVHVADGVDPQTGGQDARR